MPHLIVSFDNGLSASKCLWQRWPNGRIELMLMHPEVLEVSPDDLMDTGLAGGRPENDAVLMLGDRTYTLGMKAQELRGKPPIGLSKYEPAVYKILGLLGAIAQTANLPNEFTVAMSALLPYAEYQDRQRFIDLLQEHLASFIFRGQQYSVTAEVLDVRPEGAGLAQNHRSKSPESFDRRNTLVFMLGQRDASLLPFKQGTPQKGKGDRLGFAEFLNDVAVRAALNLEPQDMARLSEYLFKSKTQPEYIERIARMVVSESELELKVEQLNEVIAIAQTRYLAHLLGWVKSSLGQDLYEVDEVVICGGAALYFQSDLNSFFAAYKNLKVFWDADTQEQISSVLAYPIDPTLAFRVFDVYGIFRLLQNKVKRFEQDQDVQSNLRSMVGVSEVVVVSHREPELPPVTAAKATRGRGAK